MMYKGSVAFSAGCGSGVLGMQYVVWRWCWSRWV